jgi:hypothetical protein
MDNFHSVLKPKSLNFNGLIKVQICSNPYIEYCFTLMEQQKA